MAWGDRQGAGQARRIGVWWTVGALVALAVIAWGGWLMARPSAGRSAPSAADRPTASTTAWEGPSGTAGSGTSSGRGRNPGGEKPSPGGQPKRSDPTTPSGEGPQAHVEAQREQAVPLPGLPRRSQPQRVSQPLPANAQAHGKLVVGYPSKVLPTPRWAQVRTSSVSSGGSTLQATLQARIGRRGPALLEHYREALIAQGFAVFDTPALDGQQAVTFSRKRDNVVVTVDPKHSSYSLYAVLHATPRR